MKIFQNIKFPKNKKLSPLQVAFVDFVTDVVVIFFLVLVVVKPLFFAPFRVQQQSMTPNILDGEFIIVWKTPYVFGAEYERDDIVVFKPDGGENYLIKRVVGLPGETLRFTGGFTWVQNAAGEFERLNEDFLAPQNLGNTCAGSGSCPNSEKDRNIDFEVPEGKYFVMGDNRLASRDSRSCFETSCNDENSNFLEQKIIEGRAILTFARFWIEDGERNFTLKNVRVLRNPN
ncbi:signal peptidase I [Candidatus Gracilibacteria bacterium]|nr:signal peptidase I [Candidatus Gracilibacteria bacterium]MCF7856082.1 signal peptidase I [Candidatus Gracilibacteria bacterium]MCF7896501.1 signal peptidase I [Candidatus Gracilibacteria bacterium]